MKSQPGFFYGEAVREPLPRPRRQRPAHGARLGLMVDCVAAMKDVLGDKVGLALDCGPGWMPTDALRFARASRNTTSCGCEDMLTGDYSTHSERRRVPRPDHADHDADPHRRADLSAPQFQGADRDAGRQHRRPRSLRRRRHRRAEMDRRIRRPARHPDGAARHRQRRPRPGRADPGLRHAAPQLHRLRIPVRHRSAGGTTSSTACRSRSSRTA